MSTQLYFQQEEFEQHKINFEPIDLVRKLLQVICASYLWRWCGPSWPANENVPLDFQSWQLFAIFPAIRIWKATCFFPYFFVRFSSPFVSSRLFPLADTDAIARSLGPNRKLNVSEKTPDDRGLVVLSSGDCALKASVQLRTLRLICCYIYGSFFYVFFDMTRTSRFPMMVFPKDRSDF